MNDNNNIIDKMFYFSIFFNFVVFILYLVLTQSYDSIPIKFKLGPIPVNFSLNLVSLMFSLVGIIAIVVLSGAQAVASGLNDESIKLIRTGVFYIILWVFLSFFVLTFLEPLEVFGNFIYIVLTIVFTIGFIQKLGGN